MDIFGFFPRFVAIPPHGFFLLCFRFFFFYVMIPFIRGLFSPCFCLSPRCGAGFFSPSPQPSQGGADHFFPCFFYTHWVSFERNTDRAGFVSFDLLRYRFFPGRSFFSFLVRWSPVQGALRHFSPPDSARRFCVLINRGFFVDPFQSFFFSVLFFFAGVAFWASFPIRFR